MNRHHRSAPLVLAALLLALAAAARPHALPTGETRSPGPAAVAPVPAGQAAPAAAPRQAAAAASPAEQQLRGWLEAFNRGGRDGYLRFLRDHFPTRVARIDNDLEFRERTGGFELRKIEDVTPTTAACILQERASEQFARASVEVEAAAPHRIATLALRAIDRPADFPAPRLTQAQVLAALRGRLAETSAKGQFSGAVLLARGGKVLLEQAYGLADRENKIPNTARTRFRMGSMNKMFTATAVLQLVQAGKVALDRPLGTYLTGYPNREVAAKVTVQHLLTHTGGTGDIFGPEFDAHRLELRSLGDYVTLYGARGLLFEPGAKWDYSNYGFILLGVLIERVSGQSYYDYVRDHIYLPAGMTSTGSEPEDVPVPGRSKGYMRAGGVLQPNTDTLPYRGTSAGGGYTTVGDLFRFAAALTGHRLLDARHTDLLTTGKVDTGNGGKYAFGFGETRAGGTRSFGHSGGAPGMNGELRIYPESGYVVAALSNIDAAASRITAWIGDRLPKE